MSRNTRADGHRRRPRRGSWTNRALARLGIDGRRCLCPRCLAARWGMFRRERLRYGSAVYVETRIAGVRIRRQWAYDTGTLKTS